MIHPSAIIDKGAEIDENVKIGPYTIINKDVSIGSGSEIGSHVTIDSHVSLGNNCRVYQYAAIGAPPQIVNFNGEITHVEISSGTVVREFATIHRGSKEGGGVTRIGKNCYLMAYTHIAHDCILGNNVILVNNASLAGHIEVENNVTIGGLVGVHQFTKIGKFAFIGGKSAVGKDVPPFVMAAGDRAVLHGLNKVGLRRNGFSQETISTLKKAYRIIFRMGLRLNDAIEMVQAEVEQIDEVLEFIKFIENSGRGITR